MTGNQSLIDCAAAGIRSRIKSVEENLSNVERTATYMRGRISGLIEAESLLTTPEAPAVDEPEEVCSGVQWDHAGSCDAGDEEGRVMLGMRKG